ncbi:MAG TPA: hypothetical protein VNU66_13705 [Mycobacteriales bacterium]|nr:hypothetical protein [Mycobacteriales bacterium]
MGWFRKEPKGRHALGAAVTSIPSGPVAAPPLVPAQPVAPVRAERQPVGPVQPAPVRQSATGPSPVAPVERVVTAPPPVLDPLVAPLELLDVVPAAGPLLVDDAARAAGAAAAPVRSWQPAAAPAVLDEPPPVVTAAPAPPAPAPLLVDDAARRLPDAPAPVAAPAPAWVPSPVAYAPPSAQAPVSGPRVELGFTDGSFRMLDPQSTAAQRLNALVGELTRPSGTDGSAGR